MTAFQIVAILLCLAAVFAFINHRFLFLHPTVGIMLQALLASMVLLVVQHYVPPVRQFTQAFHVDLNHAVFNWMLGALLFAGSMQVDLSELKNQRIMVGVLSVVGTILSTILVAGMCYGLALLAHFALPFSICALFGAVISPTDPVAVISFLKRVGAPKDLEAIIAGESLFNDGVGVVLFTVLSKNNVSWMTVPVQFLAQSLGGIAVGLAGGWLVYQMLRRTVDHHVEVLLTIALAMGGYVLADAMGVSGPIAAVVAGLIIGNHGDLKHHADTFWEMVDETLNAILFLLVGLVILDMNLHWAQLVVGLTVIPIVLLARWVSVWISIQLVSIRHRDIRGRHSIGIMTWGGLRGGLALAMALAVPADQSTPWIVSTVAAVVVFSVLIQGSTLQSVIGRWITEAPSHPDFV